jgi:hypothetical protein
MVDQLPNFQTSFETIRKRDGQFRLTLDAKRLSIYQYLTLESLLLAQL